MGFLDTFKGNQYKKEVEALQVELDRIKATFTPEMTQANNLQNMIVNLNNEVTRIQDDINKKNQEYATAKANLLRVCDEIANKKTQIVELDDEILLQSFGIYKPRYTFATSAEYKDRLANIRTKQKNCIKENNATTGNINWTVNNSVTQGRKMVKDMQKLLVRAFNSECDDVISKVKFNNVESAEKKIKSSRDAISRLGNMMGITITNYYFNLKLQELYLAHEYALKVQEEKEEQKRIREEMREQAKLEKEIENERKKIAKEQAHYINQLSTIIKQIETTFDPEQKKALENKRDEIERELSELDKSLKDIDYRVANQKAGYVYVISNIGAFGENVYKIGMTRRLEPMDRVNELGDASVPFNFDVHAMIFSDNAPALESALHKAFENKKLNMVNHRREFFNVTLEEIETVVKKNYDKTVEFTKTAPADQYRESLKIREAL